MTGMVRTAALASLAASLNGDCRQVRRAIDCTCSDKQRARHGCCCIYSGDLLTAAHPPVQSQGKWNCTFST